MNDESLLNEQNDLGTFIIRVQHRQNSSLQGKITWIEEHETRIFRSILEMVKLIDSAIDTVSPTNPSQEVTWIDGDQEPSTRLGG